MIGKRLKTIRADKRITQSDVARYLGCARTTYTQYETGVSEPDIETINKLANYFGVTSDYLLGRSDNPTYLDASDNDVKVALFGGSGEVTDEMWDEVKRFVEFVKQKEQEKNSKGE